jgi:acyl-CoA dehydrogenase
LITAEERLQLEELRTLTMDTISVDDFDTEELRSAAYRPDALDEAASREAA